MFVAFVLGLVWNTELTIDNCMKLKCTPGFEILGCSLGIVVKSRGFSGC